MVERILRLLALTLSLTAMASAQEPAGLAKADLAKRLNIKASEVRLVSSRPVVWPDAALGLPRLDELVAAVQTPGFVMTLEAKKVLFIYTSSAKAIRFGGAVELRSQSLLVLKPVPGEPNLNSDLYQLSMAGANPRLLLARVNLFAPQPGGAIMAVRRTSRSGHDLVYLPRGTASKERTLRSAFAFGAFAANADGSKWAACERSGVGGGWSIVINSDTFPLPAGSAPSRLAWNGDRLFAWVEKSLYVMEPGRRSWEEPKYGFVDDQESLMLNKSESLDVTNSEAGARVLRVWFTGDEKEVAQIPGLVVKSFRLMLGHWSFITGTRGGAMAAYAVELNSGIVIPCLAGDYAAIELYPYPVPGQPAP